MILNQQERARLHNLVENKDFEILLKFAQELKKGIGTSSVMNLTEWDFVKGSLQKEYQMSFVDEFFRLIEQEAYDASEDGDAND